MGPGRSREWRAIAAPAAAGLLARLALIALTTPLTLSLDEERLWDLAGSRMHASAFLPPFFPFVLAGLRSLTADSILAVRVVLACGAVASIVLVYRLAERQNGPGAGRTPAWIAALLPTLIYFDGRLRSESLTILLLLAFTFLWTGPRQDQARPLLAAGVLAGLIVLARPELGLFPLILVFIGLRRAEGRRVLRRALLLLPGLLLLVVPWMVRNERVVGSRVVSTNGGYNFWKSFNPETDGSQVPVTDFSLWEGMPEERMDAVGYEAGWRYIAEHPVRSLLLAPAKWGHLFGPERDVLSDLRQGHVPRRSLLADLLFPFVQNVCWALLFGWGLYSLLGPLRSQVKDATLSLLATLLVAHAVFLGDDRFHVPLVPFLCIALPEAWDGSVRGRGALRALLLLLFGEALVWVYILARDAGRIAALIGG